MRHLHLKQIVAIFSHTRTKESKLLKPALFCSFPASL